MQSENNTTTLMNWFLSIKTNKFRGCTLDIRVRNSFISKQNLFPRDLSHMDQRSCVHWFGDTPLSCIKNMNSELLLQNLGRKKHLYGPAGSSIYNWHFERRV
jgi:hypothetical protein